MTSPSSRRYGLLSVNEALRLTQSHNLLKPIARAYEAAERITECQNCGQSRQANSGSDETSGKIEVRIDGKRHFIACPLLNPKCRYGRELQERLGHYTLDAVTSLHGLPLRFHETLADPKNTAAVRGANAWACKTARKCFFTLYGEHGTGKSFGAAYALYVIARVRNEKNWNTPHLWTGLSAMWVSAYRVTTRDELFENALYVPILVIDDLGGEGNMPRLKDKINEIISERYNNMLLTILTMNGDCLELEKMYGRRLFDRVLSVSDSVHCGGESFRLLS